jgi:hypothetical protein
MFVYDDFNKILYFVKNVNGIKGYNNMELHEKSDLSYLKKFFIKNSERLENSEKRG